MSRIKEALVASTNRERPILLSGYWVRALVEGRKTQTRRVVFKRPLEDGLMPPCPFGKPGDSLWVREAWRTPPIFDNWNASQLAASCLGAGYAEPWAPIRYEADGLVVNWDKDTFPISPGRLRCSRFMPRWASRVNLLITAVCVERLQDISEADALAEGVPAGPTWRKSWRNSWDEVNGKRGYPWANNPWVWVVSFCPSFAVVRGAYESTS